MVVLARWMDDGRHDEVLCVLKIFELGVCMLILSEQDQSLDERPDVKS